MPEGAFAPGRQPERKIALLLTGGGARAAYQVGVLRAIAEMLPRGAASPFQVVCGTSAGAINAAGVAADAANFRRAVRRLVGVWKNFRAAHVYRTDVFGMARCAARWLLALVAGGIRETNPVSLLDNSPLAELLRRHHDSEGVERSIATGHLTALSVTASGYGSGEAISFFHGMKGLEEWRRARRAGVAARIDVEHLLASAAIPFMFPAIRIGNEFFGDGAMRQTAPISPALHLGADRVLVICVSRRAEATDVRSSRSPSLAHIAGHALNSLFDDGLEADLERLERTNRTLARIPPHALLNGLGSELKHVDCMVLSPSKPLEHVALKYMRTLPWTVRYFLRAIGAMRRSGGNFASYILFERPFCRALMQLGYQDTIARRDEVASFLRIRLPLDLPDTFPETQVQMAA